MIPYVIELKSSSLIEHFEDNIYSYVEKLEDIYDKIKDFILNIIEMYENEIFISLKYKDLDWEKFCCIVNSKPYDCSLFFSIMYFEIRDKYWKKLDIEDIWIERIFIKLIKQKFNLKINYSNSITKCFDKVNNYKYKKCLKQTNINLTIEL